MFDPPKTKTFNGKVYTTDTLFPYITHESDAKKKAVKRRKAGYLVRVVRTQLHLPKTSQKWVLYERKKD